MRAFLLVLHVLFARAEECDFQKVDARSLSGSYHFTQNEPLLIRGVPGRKLWKNISNRDSFKELFGNLSILVSHHVYSEKSELDSPMAANSSSFDEWLEQLDNKAGVPYVFRRCNQFPNCDAYIESEYGIPKVVRGSSLTLFIAAGKSGAGAPLQATQDPTWEAAIAGKTAWYAFRPDRDGHVPAVSRIRDESLFSGNVGVKHCIQKPGEIVFLPAGWMFTTYFRDKWALKIGGTGAILTERGVYEGARGDIERWQPYKDAHGKTCEVGGAPEDNPILTPDAAVMNGHAAMLRLMIDEMGARPNRQLGGYSYIHFAASWGHVAILDYLANSHPSSCKLNAFQPHGRAVVHTAAQKGHVAVMEWLIKQQAQLGAKVKETGGHTAMHIAAEFGRVEVVKLLIANGRAQDALATTSPLGATPVHTAAEGGHGRILGVLADHDPAVLSAKLTNGMTSGHICAMHGHVTCIEILVNANTTGLANADNANNLPADYALKGNTPEHKAVLMLLKRKGIYLDDEL